MPMKDERKFALYALVYQYFFFHPDYTVGFGISPNQLIMLADFTANREFRPVLKIYLHPFILVFNIIKVNNINSVGVILEVNWK